MKIDIFAIIIPPLSSNLSLSICDFERQKIHFDHRQRIHLYSRDCCAVNELLE